MNECFCRDAGMNSMSLPLSLLFLGLPRLFLLGPARVFFGNQKSKLYRTISLGVWVVEHLEHQTTKQSLHFFTHQKSTEGLIFPSLTLIRAQKPWGMGSNIDQPTDNKLQVV